MLSRLSLRTGSRTIIVRRSLSILHRRHFSRQLPHFVRVSTASQGSSILGSLRAYSSAPMAAPTDTQASEVQNSTGITPDSIAQTLREKLDASHVDIQDISGGCGQSFAALIVSSQFQGKAALARHRLVNGLLKEEIAAIHAWTPRCLTPEQWEKEKQKTSTQ